MANRASDSEIQSKASAEHMFNDVGRRDRYLAMLSHDLRSAITGVIGGLSGIDSARLDERSNEHRESALAAAADVTRLLDGILDMEAIEKNEFILDEVDTNLDEFLLSLQRRWATRADAKDIELTVSKSVPIADTITVDANRLARVLGNIIENAIKYTDVGSVTVVAGMTDRNAIAFRIRDEGPGFSEDAMSRLFEFRGRPDYNAKPGSGLGLHIAKTLVSQMGGEIHVKNVPAGGAELKVVVPIEGESAPNQASVASVSVLPNATLPDLSDMNIMLAEDNLTNQLVVSQMLDAMGATFQVASDGVEALALFEQDHFDLILMDIEMPRMSGLDVIRTIRAGDGSRSNTPIVALTAYAMREHRERIASAGADGLIAKPILGIEDFGVDILRYTKSSRNKPDVSNRDGAAREDDSLIDSEIFSSLEKTLGPDTMKELLTKVAEDLTSIRSEITSAIATDDLALFRSSSHVLISVSGAIGALSTQQLAEHLNKSSHSGKLSDIRLVATGCLTNIDRLLKFASGTKNSN